MKKGFEKKSKLYSRNLNLHHVIQSPAMNSERAATIFRLFAFQLQQILTYIGPNTQPGGGPISQNREKSSKNTHHEHRYLIPARTNLSIVVVSHFYQQEPNIEDVLAIQRNCSEKLVSDWLTLDLTPTVAAFGKEVLSAACTKPE